MSYILDALARSHLSRPPETGMRALSERALLKKVGIGALLAIAILLGTAGVDLWRNERSQAPYKTGSPQVLAEIDTTDIPSMPLRPSRPASAAAAAAGPPAAVTPTRSAARPIATPTEPSGAVRFSPPIALSQPLPAPSPLGPGGAYVAGRSLPADSLAPPPPAREAARTVALAELKPLSALPTDLRAAVAQMKVRLLFYAPQRRSRFVMIDSRELREGDELLDGLRLEEITDNGLVIRHKDSLVLAPTLAGR